MCPRHSSSALEHGFKYHKTGNYAEAETLYRRAIEQDPLNFLAYYLLGLIAYEFKTYEQAISLIEKSLSIKPSFNLEAFHYLGNAYKMLGRQDTRFITKAKDCFLKILKQDQNNILAYENLVNLYQMYNDLEQAESYAQDCIRINPNSTKAFATLGYILGQQGKFQESKEAYLRSIELDPNYAEAYYLLSSQHKFVSDDDLISKMQSLLIKSSAKSDQIHLNFALAKAYDDLHDYKKAGNYLIEANRIKREQINYQVETDKYLFAEIITHYKNFLKPYIGSIANSSLAPRPVFILGMPRSGTSLIEQILASHPQIYGAGELYNLAQVSSPELKKFQGQKYPFNLAKINQEDLQSMRDKYLSSLQELAPGFNFITDKMPSNFMFLGLIQVILPEARIIYCQRDPLDTCLSNYKQLFVRGQDFSYDLKELGEYYKAQESLMNYWLTELGSQIYTLEYEKLINNTKEETQQILNFIGLDWDDNCLEFYKQKRTANTASAAQVKQPIYKSSIKAWENYKDILDPLIQALS